MSSPKRPGSTRRSRPSQVTAYNENDDSDHQMFAPEDDSDDADFEPAGSAKAASKPIVTEDDE